MTCREIDCKKSFRCCESPVSKLTHQAVQEPDHLSTKAQYGRPTCMGTGASVVPKYHQVSLQTMTSKRKNQQQQRISSKKSNGGTINEEQKNRTSKKAIVKNRIDGGREKRTRKMGDKKWRCWLRQDRWVWTVGSLLRGLESWSKFFELNAIQSWEGALILFQLYSRVSNS